MMNVEYICELPLYHRLYLLNNNDDNGGIHWHNLTELNFYDL